MNQVLKPFSSKPKCWKCGSRKVNRSYHKNGECEYGCVHNGAWRKQEHHLMICQNCRYEWHERMKPLNPQHQEDV